MTPNRWLILAALFLARSTLGYQYQSVASVSPLLVDDLGINFAEVGALIGFYSLLGIVPDEEILYTWGEAQTKEIA